MFRHALGRRRGFDPGARPQTVKLPSMSGPLAGKVALVTGASRGIGRAIARKLASAGSDVAVNYYNSHDEAESLCVELRAMGRAAQAVQGSVGIPASVAEMFAEIGKDFERLDHGCSNSPT